MHYAEWNPVPPMKCAKCLGKGKRSRVFVLFGPYYDEDGHYIGYPQNAPNGIYACSRGHHFSPGFVIPDPTQGA